MKKEQIKLEYPLKNASVNLIWNAIGTPLGLSQWFSDGVTVNNNEYTFSWDENEQTAFLKEQKNGKYIRFQWEDDAHTDVFFQLEIQHQDITGNVALIITDFVSSEEKNDTILLWDNQIDILKRKNGI